MQSPFTKKLALFAAAALLAAACAPATSHDHMKSDDKSDAPAAAAATPAPAQPAADAPKSTDATAPAAGSAAKPDPDAKRVAQALKALALNDPDKESKVSPVLYDYFHAMRAWHTENDPKLKDAWSKWSDAGKSKDMTDRAKGYEPVRAIYASFQPSLDKLNSDLGALLTPEQVEKVKDSWTQGKVAFTMRGNTQMIPELTDDQKAKILAELKQAREDGIETTGKVELNNIFKAHKNVIEKYIDDWGYDYNKRYKQWVTNMNAAKAPKAAPAAGSAN